MTALPAVLYRSPGIYTKPGNGGTYNIQGVKNQEALDAHLSAGWFLTSLEAITAAGDKAFPKVKPKPKWMIKAVKKKKPGKPLDWREKAKEAAIPAVPAPSDNAPPTRAELETKAAQLGIKFDGLTRDKKLGQLIQEQLTGE